ncbi:MAG: NAD-dependent protein deacylase [Granulosicoccus sp.]|nr:NAD-dependent protein deacylase [Granulosicoccus sp.]
MRQLQAARRLIDSASRPVSFSGAGLSAESGIATFRGHDDDALWNQYDPTQLASQQGFSENPELVIEWYKARRRTLHAASPNAAHKTLSQQNNWIHITQNVDNLLESAGADPNDVLHLHGSLLRDHCNANCGFTEIISLADPPDLRQCPKCHAALRPSVIWFGEPLDDEVFNLAVSHVMACDLLLVIGTSAQVYPAAGLIELADQHDASVVLINTESVKLDSERYAFVQGKASEVVPLLFNSEPS